MATYNYIRFDSIVEFGHNYLPEFANEPQFSLRHVPGNFLEILKLPQIRQGALIIPKFNGTMFFLVNPIYILLGISMLKNKLGAKQIIFLLCLIAHFILMLSHKTMGGWQFGSRYLIDMIPFMLVIFTDDKCYKIEHISKAGIAPIVLAVMGIAINIYGAIWYYTMA